MISKRISVYKRLKRFRFVSRVEKDEKKLENRFSYEKDETHHVSAGPPSIEFGVRGESNGVCSDFSFIVWWTPRKILGHFGHVIGVSLSNKHKRIQVVCERFKVV